MYGDKGSPCLQPISNLKDSDKYPFAKHKKYNYCKIIQICIELLKLNISNAFSMKDHGKESNAFSKATNTKRPGILCVSVYCIMLYINLVFSPMYLPFIIPV